VVIEDSHFRILHDGTQLATCAPHRYQGGHPPQRQRPPQLRQPGRAAAS
jgi:hypothetical protein